MSLSDDCIVSHPIYVKSNGVMFKKNVLMLISFDVLDPVFCKIVDILNTKCGLFLMISEHKTLYYDDHYHAYAIQKHSELLRIVNTSSIPFSNVLHPRRSFDKNEDITYINLKTYIETF